MARNMDDQNSRVSTDRSTPLTPEMKALCLRVFLRFARDAKAKTMKQLYFAAINEASRGMPMSERLPTYRQFRYCVTNEMYRLYQRSISQ